MQHYTMMMVLMRCRCRRCGALCSAEENSANTHWKKTITQQNSHYKLATKRSRFFKRIRLRSELKITVCLRCNSSRTMNIWRVKIALSDSRCGRDYEQNASQWRVTFFGELDVGRRGLRDERCSRGDGHFWTASMRIRYIRDTTHGVQRDCTIFADAQRTHNVTMCAHFVLLFLSLSERLDCEKLAALLADKISSFVRCSESSRKVLYRALILTDG